MKANAWMEECGWLKENRWISLSFTGALAPSSPACPSSALLSYLRRSPDHSHSFLALKLCFSTFTPLQTLANIPCCQQCRVQAPSSPLVHHVLRIQRAKEKSRLWSIDVLEADPQYLVYMKSNLRFCLQRWLILCSETALTGNEYLGKKMQLGTFK